MLYWPALIIGMAILVLFLSGPPADGIFDSEQSQTHALYIAIVVAALVMAGAGRILARGGRRTVVHTAVWLVAISGLAIAFAFRDEATVIVHEIRAKLRPTVALSRAGNEAELSRDWDGHYRADAEVNGVELRLMVDTGSSMVMIPYEDAARIGIDPATLDFSMPVTTANGRSAVAPIELSSVKVGPIALFGVPAAVAQPGRLKIGLLGMSFLSRLSETSFQGDKLILRLHGVGGAERFQRAPESY